MDDTYTHHVDVDGAVEFVGAGLTCECDGDVAQHGTHPHANIGIVAFFNGHSHILLEGGVGDAAGKRVGNAFDVDGTNGHIRLAVFQTEILQDEIQRVAVLVEINADDSALRCCSIAVERHDEVILVVLMVGQRDLAAWRINGSLASLLVNE